MSTGSVMIVEDDGKLRANLEFQLRQVGFIPVCEERAEPALVQLESLQAPLPDLLLVDVRLPGMSGVELVRRLALANRLPATIIISGEASISETVEALRLGVHDFIEKPFTKERLAQSIRNTLEHTALVRQVAELRSELGSETEILGTSAAVGELRKLIARAAPTDARVLIRGESGTGKELVANALHQASDRRGQPFIKINCASIPTHLIEDELFGHARGAFTDARTEKPGLFEEANRGTLFLDEIGDMDYQLQSRLLRVLEDGQVRRIGENRERDVDVRVLAATHADLETAIEEKSFRQDLYFRLAHLPIDVPPLRRRTEDVGLLFEHFLRHFSRCHRMRHRRVEPGVLRKLESYPWPGNVRELRSLCERLVVFGADPISVGQLPCAYRGDVPMPQPSLLRPDGESPILTLKDFKARSEKEYIESVLEHTHWNVAAAARVLGIQRTYLHQKLQALGSQRPVIGREGREE